LKLLNLWDQWSVIIDVTASVALDDGSSSGRLRRLTGVLVGWALLGFARWFIDLRFGWSLRATALLGLRRRCFRFVNRRFVGRSLRATTLLGLWRCYIRCNVLMFVRGTLGASTRALDLDSGESGVKGVIGVAHVR